MPPLGFSLLFISPLLHIGPGEVEGREETKNDTSSPKTEGCFLNGTLFGEGSAMVAPSHCEYCYCIKARQHCVRPQCLLNVPGCTPQYAAHSCCPIKYHCSDLRNSTKPPTTTESLSYTTTRQGCWVNGTSYPEGEKVEAGGFCENCYCVQGNLRCEPILCTVPTELCIPITPPGHCCPSSYNCSTAESLEDSSTKDEDIWSTEMVSTTTEVGTTYSDGTESWESSTLEQSSTDMETEPPGSTEVVPATNNTQLRSGTTREEATTRTTVSDRSSPVPDPLIEALINRTRLKDQDYEIDYQSSLPPSLPNLKIIPFVAADAVLSESDDDNRRSEIKTDTSIYFDAPHKNRFSPPVETEGGFVPRDPTMDGPFYESKFEEPFTTGHNGVPMELTSETLLPPITEPPKLFEENKCEKEGVTYHHGEVVSEPNACELCVCYFGEVHCQKPDCPPLNKGCHRIPNNKKVCCGQIVCGNDNPSKIIEAIEASTLVPENLSNIPAVTIADVIVTPNPFKDVIRTEPAPNLTDIMKDMLPHLQNLTSISKNDLKKNKNSTNISSEKNITYSSTGIRNTTENFTAVKAEEHNVTTLRPETSVKSHEEEDDSFSLGSVLDLLFRGETIEKSTTRRPNGTRTTTKQPSSPLYSGISQTDSKQEINNAIENLDFDYGTNQKDKNLDRNSPIPVFNDYKNKNESKFPENGKKDTTTMKMPLLGSTTKGKLEKVAKEDFGAGMVKLAGCNIYGRMYRLGRVITELSGPCQECLCTELGVKCRDLC